MCALITAELESVTAVLSTFKEVRCAYLFGSRALGTNTARSDYDFGLLCDPGLSQQRYAQLQFDVAGRLSIALRTDRVDVVVINSASSIELKFAIVHDGQVVYGQPDFEVEMHIRHEHEDFASMRGRLGTSILRAAGTFDGTR